MSKQFSAIGKELRDLILLWDPKLRSLSVDTVSGPVNSQNRTIKQIVGHMVDSATNNTHRVIHLQYQESPVSFPDYANLGNNDRWIAIQNYEDEDWALLIDLWAATNRHYIHIIDQIDNHRLGAIWVSALNEKVSLESMILDFPRHFKLHLAEIEDLI